MRIDYAKLSKLPLLETANFNFALACRHYELTVEQASGIYAEMFTTGDPYEIHHFVGTDCKVKKYFFTGFALAAYLSDKYDTKMSIHHIFCDIYDLSEKQFQTDRSSQTDINRVISSIWGFQQDRKLITDPVRAKSVASEAMKKAYGQIEEMV